MKIALGPVQYYWSREAIMSFYADMTAAPIDIVYLGEAICSRRHEMRLPDWLEVADLLASAGKEVVLSTQILLESGKDITTLRSVATNGRYMVEANDMGAVHCVQNTPFVAGAWLNIYNPETLAFISNLGASRWVAPLEMSRASLETMLAARRQDLQTEIFAYGRMPLAFSARCFTARHRNIPKENCQYVCMDYPDGLTLRTREGNPFLVLNGISTQSAQICNLIAEIDTLSSMNVDVIRISPQSQHTTEIANLFRAVIDHKLDGNDALSEMRPLALEEFCNGYWHGVAGMEQVVA